MIIWLLKRHFSFSLVCFQWYWFLNCCRHFVWDCFFSVQNVFPTCGQYISVVVSIHYFWLASIICNQQVAGWPSGLRRQFKALVFGRGFESHFSHETFFLKINFFHRTHTHTCVFVKFFQRQLLIFLFSFFITVHLSEEWPLLS